MNLSALNPVGPFADGYAHRTAALADVIDPYEGPACWCGCDTDPDHADLVNRFERGEVG